MPIASDRRIAGNSATGVLKILALVFMFIDHAGKMCFPGIFELRLIGRIAFPLYCWCMVVGACHTRSMPKYLLRIALIGLASQPLYMVALNHTWNQPNIFLTLAIALCGLWGLREKRFLSHIWAPVLALAAAELTGCDYGWRGVMLTLLLYGARKSTAGIATTMIAFCLYWGSTSSGVNDLFGLSFVPLLRSEVGSVFSPWFKVQSFAILALPLMLLPMKKSLKMPRWLGYALYPAHLAALIAMEAAMGKTIHTEHLLNAWNAFIALF
ncbi:MAG: hypothetical protein IJ438_10610 [Clostridia bacterium]|nr:hypothetical protein [Clostridia bacterium]